MNERKIVPIRKEEIIGHAGGLVDETTVTLALYGDDLDPEDISKRLGSAPSSSHMRGERKSDRSPPYKQGAWLLTIEGRAPAGPDELVQRLLKAFPSDPTFWNPLVQEFRVVIWIGVHVDDWNRGFVLSPASVAAIALTGATINFDLYFDGEDGEAGG